MKDAAQPSGSLSLDIFSQLIKAAEGKSYSQTSIWDRTSTHAIRSTFKNALTALEKLGVTARRDCFSNLVLISNKEGFSSIARDYQGPFSDRAIVFLRKHIQDTFGFDPTTDHLHSAVEACAEENRFNPVVEWLNRLNWDGIPRLSNWLPSIVGAVDDELNRAIGELLLKGMVARACYPGTKFDYCVVFEGPQGCGKSTLVRKLSEGPGESYFTDAPGLVGMDNKERAELIGGKWVVELAELSGLARSEAEGVKAFLSQVSDRYRPPYGRVTVDRARVCVFVGTTNSMAYLSDSSGNRRFLPIKCTHVELTRFDDLYPQLLAEANHQLKLACAQARADGAAIILGRPLPNSFSDRHLTLPITLRFLAVDRVEERRHIDVFEEALRAVMTGTGVQRTTLPNGRKFVSAADIISALQAKLGRPPNVSGLAGHMSNLGWETAVSGPKHARVRGYARASDAP